MRSKKTAATLMVSMMIFLSLSPLIAAAQIPFLPQPNVPFGGKIVKIQACISPKALLLTIGPPMGGKFLLTDSSILHKYGNITPDTWTLGNASPTPINCRGNPKSVPGFRVGTVLAQTLSKGAGISVFPVYAKEPVEVTLSTGEKILSYPLENAIVLTPVGSFTVTGQGAQALVNLTPGGNMGGNLGQLFPPALQVAAVVSSIINGDYPGAVLGTASLINTFVFMFDPTGITQIITLVYAVISFFFPKKPPFLGPAYPIIHIGTGPEPAPNFTPPILTPI